VVGTNSIAAKNNTIATLHLDDKECCSERLAPYSELHGDNTPGLHLDAPTPLSVRLVFTLQKILRYMAFIFCHRLLANCHRTTSVMIYTFVMYLAS
jgi:hypothetical protein